MSGGAARNPASLANLRGGRQTDWITREREPMLVRLHEVEHLTYVDLAERFGVTKGAVAGMMRRARQRLESGA